MRDALAAIDTLTNKVIATIPIGQAPQAVTYVPDAVPEGDGTENLQPLGVAGAGRASARLPPARATRQAKRRPASSLFDQGLIQILQASVTGLEPKKPYVLALRARRTAAARWSRSSMFMTNPAGSAIVNAVGPIRQIVRSDVKSERRYLVIAEGTAAQPGAVVQVEELR